MGEYVGRIKAHLKFSKREVREIIIAVLIGTLIFAFDDGSSDGKFIWGRWAANAILVLFIVFVSFGLRVITQKMVALKLGFRAEFRLWSYGLAASFVLTFLTGGRVPIFFPGGTHFTHLAAERLGSFRYGLNYGSCGWSGAAGSFMNIFIGMTTTFIFGQLMGIDVIATPILHKIVLINFLMALYTLLPIPPLDGCLLFFGSRMNWAITVGITGAYVILYLFEVLSLFLAIILGILFWASYWYFFERTSR